MNRRMHLTRRPLFAAVLILPLMMLAAVSTSAEAPRRTVFDPGPAELVFPSDRDWVEVPFRLDATKIVLPLRINGAEPVDAVLDTGASAALLLDHEVAAGIDFDIIGQAQVQGAGHGGAMPTVEMAQKVRFGLGDVTLGNVSMAVMRGENPMAKKDWQAIIGDQVFQNLVVQIDWAKQVLRLADPARFEAPETATAVPIESRGGHVYLRGELILGKDGSDREGTTKPVQMVVDSGAFHALSLDARKTGALPENRIENIKLGRGLGGVVTGSVGRVASLTIGDFRFDNVVTRFPDAEYADIITSGTDGNLGAEVLRRFLVTFDYSRDQMLLEPTSTMADPFLFSTAGLAFFPALTEHGNGRVDDLYADSPAMRAGLQVDDEIVAIDGQPLEEIGLDAARDLLEQPAGTSIELAVKRGEKSFTAKLELAELI